MSWRLCFGPQSLGRSLWEEDWVGGIPLPTLKRRALKGAALVTNGTSDALIACGGPGNMARPRRR